MPRSSCGSGAAVAEATTVDIVDRRQSRCDGNNGIGFPDTS